MPVSVCVLSMCALCMCIFVQSIGAKSSAPSAQSVVFNDDPSGTLDGARVEVVRQADALKVLHRSVLKACLFCNDEKCPGYCDTFRRLLGVVSKQRVCFYCLVQHSPECHALKFQNFFCVYCFTPAVLFSLTGRASSATEETSAHRIVCPGKTAIGKDRVRNVLQYFLCKVLKVLPGTMMAEFWRGAASNVDMKSGKFILLAANALEHVPTASASPIATAVVKTGQLR